MTYRKNKLMPYCVFGREPYLDEANTVPNPLLLYLREPGSLKKGLPTITRECYEGTDYVFKNGLRLVK